MKTIELMNAKRTKNQKILGNTATKRDRQKIVKLLVRHKKTQKKIVFCSQNLSDHLLKMSTPLKEMLIRSCLRRGGDASEIQQLIDSPKMFNDGLKQAHAHLKAARKRVKDKNYKP